jgi:hypothetical protein
VYQLEVSRNLLFKQGTKVDAVFNGVIDRTRATLDIRKLKTIFGSRKRPHLQAKHGRRRGVQITVEKPAYDLTVFKVHFDYLTLKIYSKGARVLRFEAIVHNAGRLKCGKGIIRFAQIAALLRQILQRFMSNLHCVDVSFIQSNDLQSWHLPTVKETQRTAGIDSNNPRIRAVMESLIALSIDPFGITTPKLAQAVRERLRDDGYQTRHAAYDLNKFRAKGIALKDGTKNSYTIAAESLRAMVAYLTITDKVLVPVLNQFGKPKRGPRPTQEVENHFRNIQNELCKVLEFYKIAA